MIKRKFFSLGIGLAISLSPLALIAACTTESNQDNSNEKQEIPTVLKQDKFSAQELGIKQSILAAAKLINPEWIVNNKDIIFDGTTTLLTKPTQVINFLEPSVNQDELVISFQLSAGSYIDSNQKPATISSSPIKFVITNFPSDTVDPSPDELIDLKPIASQATFDVVNKNQLPSQITTIDLIWKEATHHQDVDFKVNTLFADDQNGRLGYNVTFYQKNINNNNEIITVSSTDSKAITGLKTKPINSSDQTLVNQEIERLQKSDNVINVNQLSTIDIINFTNKPQDFLQFLTNLNSTNFQYQVISFNVDENTSNLSIDLKVTKASASATVKLTKKIKIVAINIEDPNWLRQAERNRLNHLAKNSFLTQTTFSEKEIKESLQVNPNLLLKYIFKFVSTYGFHYRVFDLKFSPKQKNQEVAKYTMSFRIEAKLWRTTEVVKPSIITDLFSYDIDVTYEKNTPVNAPQPTQKGWTIEPSDAAKPSLNPDGTPDGSYNLTIDLNQNQDLDFAYINAENSDELIFKIFETKKELFIKINGELAPNWDWKNYTYFQYMDDNFNDQNQLSGLQYYLQFEYVNSKNLSDSLIINLDLINGYNSGAQPNKPNPEQLWTKYLDEFQKLIKTQKIDENKLHLGNNEIYGFAQIGTDNPSKSDYFANFLNFSPTEFTKEHQFLVDVKTKDASIDYLTNTIKFKWVLEGRNNTNININLADKNWESNEQVIKYVPTNQWADQIKFDNSDQLNIPNSISINNILDRFALGNEFVSETILKERFARFGNNWTWKARELANYVRFTFYQAFNDGAEAINMAIENFPQNANLTDNPQGYTIVLKAKLNVKVQGNYLPYLQMFGLGAPIQARQWSAGDIIEIRLNAADIPARPDVVTNGNEILPGMGPGNVLGTGKGATEAYLNTPPRNDLFSIALGTIYLTINHNGNTYLSTQKASHRFLALNMLSRYDFKDQILPEPKPEEGWTR